MPWEKEEENTAGGNFLTLKEDGAKVRGVFMGDPVKFYQRWDETENKSYIVPKSHPEARFRFKTNFAVFDDATKTFSMKIWEGGKRVNNTIHALSEEFDLSKHLTTIIRQGKGTQTNYLINPKDNLPENVLQTLAKLELHDLTTEITDMGTPPPTPMSQAAAKKPLAQSFDDEIPF